LPNQDRVTSNLTNACFPSLTSRVREGDIDISNMLIRQTDIVGEPSVRVKDM